MTGQEETPGIEIAQLPRVEQLKQRAAELAAKAQQLSAEEASTDLVPASGIGVAPAERVREEAVDKRAELMITQRELRKTVADYRAELEKQAREWEARLAPMREKVQQLEEVIATANLYLGKAESIVRLRGGEPAPADTPITVRQMVLSMDEETAILVGHGGEQTGMDHANIELFDQWLLEDPAHLDQITPEQKGVVAIVPRRRGKDYGDPWANKARNQENLQTYFLVRNGAQLARMDTDFNVGENLVPKRTEFVGFFREQRWNSAIREYETVDLVPGTHQWARAEKQQGARQRHFMKVALILQGLIDRTNLFEPLPEGGISLLHPESYEQGKAIMLADGENSLTTLRKPFYMWLRDLNAQLQPGMRVIGQFGHQTFRTSHKETTWRGREYNGRIHPIGASYPHSSVIHRIERRDGDGFAFLYERTDEIWKRDQWGRETYEVPTQRASARVYPSDPFIIPIDLVDVPTMQGYLHARTERRAYFNMFPVLKTAIAIKDREAAEEAPFIDYLAAQAATDLQVNPEGIKDDLKAVVAWWKLGNKWHRPLVNDEDPAAVAKAATAILKEFKSRTLREESMEPEREAAVLSQVKAHTKGQLLYLGRRTDDSYLGFARQPLKYGEAEGFHDDVWTTELKVSRTGKITTRDWVLPGVRAAKTRELFAAEAWEKWNRSVNYREFLTDSEIDQLTVRVTDAVEDALRTKFRSGWSHDLNTDPEARVFGVTYDPINSFFTAWVHSPVMTSKEAIVDRHSTMDAKLLSYTTGWKKDNSTVQLTLPNMRDRLRLEMVDRWFGGKPTDEDSRPWGKVWDGCSRDPRPLMERPEILADFRKHAALAAKHNGAIRERSQRVNDYLYCMEKDIHAIVEEAAHAAYLEEYKDPEGWEDHRRNLTIRGTQLRDSFGGSYSHPVAKAVSKLIEGGADIEGRSVRGVLATAGASAEDVEKAEEQGLLDLTFKRKWSAS